MSDANPNQKKSKRNALVLPDFDEDHQIAEVNAKALKMLFHVD